MKPLSHAQVHVLAHVAMFTIAEDAWHAVHGASLKTANSLAWRGLLRRRDLTLFRATADGVVALEALAEGHTVAAEALAARRNELSALNLDTVRRLMQSVGAAVPSRFLVAMSTRGVSLHMPSIPENWPVDAVRAALAAHLHTEVLSDIRRRHVTLYTVRRHG